MRTIGKKNRDLVRKVTLESLQDGNDGIQTLREVPYRLPLSLWDIWESAESEIIGLITETILEYQRDNS